MIKESKIAVPEKKQLPEFSNPPVVETVLGVQFDPIEGFGTVALGAYWKTLDSQWSTVEDALPIADQFEEAGRAGQIRHALNLQMVLGSQPSTSPYSTRLRISNAANDRMIQVQNTRFHFNWIGHRADVAPAYLHFRESMEEFESRLAHFSQFLNDESLGKILPNQWEITYVNHIPKQDLWETPGDWPGIIELLGDAEVSQAGLSLERFSGDWTYSICDHEPARLHVHLEPKVNTKDPAKEVLEIRLTARGPLRNETDVSLQDGLTVGHDAIINGFVALTTQKAHASWGRSK